MKYPATGIATLCKLFGKTRDAYYKSKVFHQERDWETEIILETVREIRKFQPEMGVHKLDNEIKLRFDDLGIVIGRNRLNELLRDRNLLVRPRRKQPRTTNSFHRYRKWPNLTVGLVPSRPEELLVSDITYWRIPRGFIYVSLITDAYSRMILGHHVCENLYATGPLLALEMALENRIYPDKEMIHHSDRGVQYCSNDYVAMLQQHAIKISMTQSGDPTENPVAERVNGILKQHFGLPRTFDSHQSAVQPIAKAIETYNHKFPHGSINYLKPYQAHRISGPIKNRWKKK